MNHLLLALRILLTYRNGYLFLLEKSGLRTPQDTVYATWRGFRYFTRKGSTDFGILNEIILFGDYQHHFFHEIGPDSLILDIGAQAGSFSTYAAFRTGARVISFEPSAGNYQSLLKNIEINALQDKIKPFNCAVCDKPGKRVLALDSSDNKGSFSFYSEAEQGETVECITLQDVAKHLGDNEKIDLLKIDIEGGEYDLITPNNEAFFDNVRHIAMEYHCHAHLHLNGRLPRLIKQLESFGFTVIREGSEEMGYIYASKRG